jgi:hypothetical protein
MVCNPREKSLEVSSNPLVRDPSSPPVNVFYLLNRRFMYFPKTIQKKKRRKYSLCFLVLQAVVEAGARYVVVPGILPTGCIPIVLTLFASPNRSDYDARTGCLREDNAFARYHNSALLEAVRRLRCKYPAVKIVYADYYEPVMAFLKKPTAFGTRIMFRFPQRIETSGQPD